MNLEKLNKFEDPDGTLVPIELKNLPFEPKRIFYITNVPFKTERGNHAHYETQQVLICIKGCVLVKLYDGVKTTKIKLRANESVFIDKMIWDSQIFLTEQDVLLVVCSTNYDLKDYISDRKEFEKIKKMETENVHTRSD